MKKLIYLFSWIPVALMAALAPGSASASSSGDAASAGQESWQSRMMPNKRYDTARSGAGRVVSSSEYVEPVAPSVYSALFGAGLSAHADAEAPVPVIYGTVIASDAWPEGDVGDYTGMYSFAAKSPLSITSVKQYYSLSATGGGTLAGDKYYVLWTVEDWGRLFTTFGIYDTETWECVDESFSSSLCPARDLTYDSITGNIYGCFLREDNGFFLGILDKSSGSASEIASLEQPLCTLAANNEGTLYGIAADGCLYLVDKTTAEMTEIGATGLIPYNQQSATFDSATDIMYWTAATADGKTALCTVDTFTGSAHMVATFPNNEEFAGIFIAAPLAPAEAPAQIENLALEYTDGSLTGNVRFTMPTETYGGMPLSGPVSYNILVDDVLADSGAGAAGENICHQLTVEDGSHIISVYASNGEGNGPSVKAGQWFGIDQPCAPTDIKLTKDESKRLHISWKAPSVGFHDGYVDPEKLEYTVVRLPDYVTVGKNIKETSLMELIEEPSFLTSVSYMVTAYCDGKEGLPGYSNSIPFGPAYEVPYSEDFSAYYNYSNFTAIDANQDMLTFSWSGYDQCAKNQTMFSSSVDDWLLTPPLRLSTGKAYRLSFKSKVLAGTEYLRVCIGKDNTVEAMTTEILADTELSDLTYRTFTVDFRVDVPADYFIGFNHDTKENAVALYIDDIYVEEIESVPVPSAVSELTVTPAEKGALSARISFVLPTAMTDGAALEHIDNACLYRNDRLIHTFDNPTPGMQIDYTDNEAVQGTNTYSVIVSDAGLKSDESRTSVYVGYDTPSGCRNVTLKFENGKPVISWLAPAGGSKGHYIDPAQLVYFIVNAYDNSVVAQNLAVTSYTDENWQEPDNQYFLRYIVYAASAAGLGDGSYTGSVLVGKPYGLPYSESFADGHLSSGPWESRQDFGNTAVWEHAGSGVSPEAQPYDGDNGIITFISGPAGESALLCSGKVNIGTSSNPVLSFYLYHSYMQDNTLEVRVFTPDGNSDVLLTLIADTPDENGWREITIPLKDYRDADYVRIGFNAISGANGLNLHLDNVNVANVTTSAEAVGPGLLSAAVRVLSGQIVVENASGRHLNIFGIDGKSIVSRQLGSDKEFISVEKGIYLVNIAGEETVKVAVK